MRNYCKEYRLTEKNPFAAVPWSEDFLACTAELVEHFIKEKHVAMQDIVLVFPNIRPKRYLTARYKEKSARTGSVCLLPQMYTNTEFYGLCLQHFERGLPLFSEQSALDSYALLFEAVKTIRRQKQYSHFSSVLADNADSLLTDFGDMFKDGDLQLAKFFPWASSLYALFEECFHELVLPQNIRYAGGEVSLFAQSLLAELEEIFAAYTAAMQKNMRTTPAYGLFRTAKYVQALSRYENGETVDTSFIPFLEKQDYASYFAEFMPKRLRGKVIVFAGFVRPSKAEEVILRYFWERGACISLHTDPNLALSKLGSAKQKVHYSCTEHKKWAESWQADLYALPAVKTEKAKISFLPAYDVHSQLAELKKDIKPCLDSMQERDDFCAVVLPSSSLLMPVLHELPKKNINISLGYPVARTLLWQFAELVFRLQKNKKQTENPDSEYLTEDVLALLQHPYTKMLLGNAENVQSPNFDGSAEKQHAFSAEDFAAWRKVLYHAQKELGSKGIYVNLQEFLTEKVFDLDNVKLDYTLSDDLFRFVDEFFEHTVFSWEEVKTMREVGERLNVLALFLINFGADVWRRFPLDREAMARFVQNTVPSLMQNGLSEEPLPLKALFGIAEEHIAAERVPFEADPLTGLQVLGLLETRLLRFDHVFIPECTESALPGMQKQDELMPDSLRTMLGLPDRQSKERIIAHAFYRLIHGAKYVWCYWQEGVQSSEIQSSKSVRSRFIEELVWEREKQEQAKREQDRDTEILRKTECSPKAPKRREKKNLVISGEIFKTLEKQLGFGLFASGLNTFLQCPVRFYYQYVAKIRQQEECGLGDNRPEFGSRMHALLNKSYAGAKKIRYTEENFAKLMADFHTVFSKDNWQECLAPDSYFMLQQSGKYFLEKFWQEEAEKNIEIVELEHEFSHTVSHPAFSVPVKFAGVADRVDKRGDSYWIVDYKTNSNTKKQIKLWNRPEFFEDLQELNKNWDSRRAREALEVLAEEMPDIQLPLYLYLFAKSFAAQGNRVTKKTKINASWIFLAERGKEDEFALVDAKLAKSEDGVWDMACAIRDNYMEIVLHFILNYMACEKEWPCRENKYCPDCPYREFC